MLNYCFLVVFCTFVAHVSALKCAVQYDFPENQTEPAQKENVCADKNEYCVCVTGTFKNRPFTVRDCQNTASIIVASYTHQSRELVFLCQESTDSRYSSGDYSYEYGCTDNPLICSPSILHQENQNLTMKTTGSNSESRVTVAMSSLILSAVYYILK